MPETRSGQRPPTRLKRAAELLAPAAAAAAENVARDGVAGNTRSKNRKCSIPEPEPPRKRQKKQPATPSPGELPFTRVPRGTSPADAAEKRRILDALEADETNDIPIKRAPCPVAGCNHVLFSYSLFVTNKKLLQEHKKTLPVEDFVAFDVPRRPDGSIVWDDAFEWSSMKSGRNYNNYLRVLKTHFLYEMLVKKCEKHKAHCPAILVQRAQKALNGSTDPANSTHKYRSLWEALGLSKEDKKK